MIIGQDECVDLNDWFAIEYVTSSGVQCNQRLYLARFEAKKFFGVQCCWEQASKQQNLLK
jgi:hypothetical protein